MIRTLLSLLCAWTANVTSHLVGDVCRVLVVACQVVITPCSRNLRSQSKKVGKQVLASLASQADIQPLAEGQQGKLEGKLREHIHDVWATHLTCILVFFCRTVFADRCKLRFNCSSLGHCVLQVPVFCALAVLFWVVLQSPEEK
jgi:hypothetical protein